MLNLNLNDEIKRLFSSGKVIVGSKKTIKSLKMGKTKGLIVAQNTPKEIMGDINYYSQFRNIPVIEYPNNSIELGSVCGNPYPVCSIGILNTGKSKILSSKKGAK